MVNKDSKCSSVEDGLDILDPRCVLSPMDNYRGIPYGELVVRWTTWLMSAFPDDSKIGDILFLRGNIGHHTESDSFYNGNTREVDQGTAILIPVITTFYTIGDTYEGMIIDDVDLLKRAVDEHVDAAGPFWATIKIMNTPGQPTKKVVKNLEDFKFKSSLFSLAISEKNPFLDKMDVPALPGTRTALAGGYFVLLKDLSPSRFTIRFGGKGFGNFFTDSFYEITVTATRSIVTKDISGPKTSPDKLIQKI